MAQRHRNNKRSPFGGIIGIGIVLVIAYVLLKVLFGTVSMVWGMLSFVAPVLFILAMFLNFGVVKDYAKMVVDTFKKDTGKGLMYAIGSFLGFPFLAPFLFYKAYTTRSTNKASEKKVKNKKEDEDYIKYEEVDDEDFLDLPEIEEDIIEPEAKPLNRYDDLFSE